MLERAYQRRMTFPLRRQAFHHCRRCINRVMCYHSPVGGALTYLARPAGGQRSHRSASGETSRRLGALVGEHRQKHARQLQREIAKLGRLERSVPAREKLLLGGGAGVQNVSTHVHVVGLLVCYRQLIIAELICSSPLTALLLRLLYSVFCECFSMAFMK